MKKTQITLNDEEELDAKYSHIAILNDVNQALIRIKAPAKINLNLNILGKRKDGYHELDTIMQSVAIFDVLQISVRKANSPSIEVSMTPQISLQAKDNLVYKAANIFLETYNLSCAVHIHLEKHIPMAAGLAGGSTDAAAVLLALYRLYKEEKTKHFFKTEQNKDIAFDELLSLAEQLGADVPFCLVQGTALCEGKGEIITPLENFDQVPLVLFNPNISVYTKEAFSYINAAPYEDKNTDIEKMNRIKTINRILKERDFDLFSTFKNDFSEYLFSAYPELESMFQIIKKTNCKFIRFTGSGPTIFALYENIESRNSAFSFLQKEIPHGRIFSTETCLPVHKIANN